MKIGDFETTCTMLPMMKRRRCSFLVALSLFLVTLRIESFTPTARCSTLKRSYYKATTTTAGHRGSSCFHDRLKRGTPSVSSSNNIAISSSSRDRKKNGILFAENNPSRSSSNNPSSYLLKDSIMKEAVQILQRTSWLSWWSQMILTVISTVILGFAKTSHAKDAPNLVLSGVAVFISGLSIVWTWGNGARLSRRLQYKPATRGAAANMLRRAVRVGVLLNLVGLLCNLLAAQEIIGGLALKVLTQRQSLLDGGLQPLDVLVVQANANSLLSHYISLACLLYLTQQITRLDPPSRDGVDDV
jgi:hypothetical protein